LILRLVNEKMHIVSTVAEKHKRPVSGVAGRDSVSPLLLPLDRRQFSAWLLGALAAALPGRVWSQWEAAAVVKATARPTVINAWALIAGSEALHRIP
jgi:hypothetical protein